MFRRCAPLTTILTLLLTGPAYPADTKKASPSQTDASKATSAAQVKKKAGPPATTLGQRIPDGPGLNILIRRTLLTINDANLSGNYSVLRDLAAPDFQAANSQAALVGIFADLRNRNVDLAPILMFDPKLVRQPQLDDNGMLHLSGIIATMPEQVNFDLLFQNISSRWRLFGVALNTTRSQAYLPAQGSTP